MSIAKILPDVINLLAICDQPPGDDPKSNRFESFLINLNFSFNSINLNEALDLNPRIFDFLKNWSRCCLIFQELLF